MRLLPVLIVVLCLAMAQRTLQLFSVESVEAKEQVAAKADTALDVLPNIVKDVGKLDGSEIVDFTPSELDLLKSLRERREEISGREEGLEQQQRVLKAMEKRLQSKVNELNDIKQQIESVRSDITELSQKFKKNESEQIASLTRIYEKMKSKDAARIFNNLDLEIVIDVVKEMKEARVAPIMAAMDPIKATKITHELGERVSLPEVEEMEKVAEQVGAEQAKVDGPPL